MELFLYTAKLGPLAFFKVSIIKGFLFQHSKNNCDHKVFSMNDSILL